MIPEGHKESIIQSGLNFIRSITEAYGTDEGMKLWDNIADTLDPDIKGHIFFAMLTGEYNSNITVSGHNGNADRIVMIKTIRNVDVRGLSLKEAKDMICNDLAKGHPIKLEVNPNTRSMALSELRRAGMLV